MATPTEVQEYTFPEMLHYYKKQVALALPKTMDPDRIARIALTEFNKTAKLQQCTPVSIFACVIQSAQLGLEPGLNGRAFLVPYANNKKNGILECQLIPGWKGLLELANRTGRSSAWTNAAQVGDLFEYMLGDSPFVKHLPKEDRNPDAPERFSHFYAVGRINGSVHPIIEVWTEAKVRAHFKRYNKQGNKHYAHSNWEMYGRKIPLLQVLKYLPSSPELQTAVALDIAGAHGRQDIDLQKAIDGSWAPPADLPDPDDDAGTANDGEVSEGAQKMNAAAAQSSGKATKEAPKAPTFAEVAQMINTAKTIDDVDGAVGMCTALPEDQRKELVELGQSRKAEMSGK